jgi:hypothetical protein
VVDGHVSIGPDDLPGAWRGIAEWTEADGLFQGWRISRRGLQACLSDLLTSRAMIPNGGRIVLRTDASALEIDTMGDPLGDSVIDVLVDGALASRHIVAEQRQTVQAELPGRMHLLEVWLPHSARARIGPLRLHGAEHVAPGPAERIRWIAYGSSLTQSGAAAGPSETWPVVASRLLGWELDAALGMASECHLDPAIARQIRDAHTDVVFVCPAVNIFGSATFNARSLPSAITGFLTTIREANPAATLVVMTPFAMAEHEDAPNRVELSLSRIRELTAAGTQVLIDQGDARLHLIDGRDILSMADQELLSDGVHPTAEGYGIMAQRLAPRLRAALDATRSATVGSTGRLTDPASPAARPVGSSVS